jgi:uncharacterized membrane protein
MCDRMAKRNWRYLLFLLASHHPKEKLDHTIRIGLHGKNIYLCSRCTGVTFGMASIFAAKLFRYTFPITLYLPLIALLPLMAAVDWFTQSAKLRESTTWLRVTSGFFLGNSYALILLLLIGGFYLQFLFAFGIGAVYAISIYLIASKTKCLELYLNEMNQIQISNESIG